MKTSDIQTQLKLKSRINTKYIRVLALTNKISSIRTDQYDSELNKALCKERTEQFGLWLLLFERFDNLCLRVNPDEV
jgi:hypothetical protein